MPQVTVTLNGRAYALACDDGEEEHLHELAAHVDAKMGELIESVGQVGDQRLLLMAAIVIADERHDALSRLDAATRNLEDIAAKLSAA